MGHRANLVTVDRGRTTLYSNRWCASTLTRDLFWGPDHGLRFIQSKDEVGASGWLDDTWAEGGALLDRDRQRLLLFGGEDLLTDIPLRRIYLAWLTRLWPSWKIEWAYEGIADLVDAVGVSRERVLTVFDPEGGESLLAPERPAWIETVGSYRGSDRSVRLFPLGDELEAYLCRGPELGRSCLEGGGAATLDLRDAGADVIGGFDLDEPGKVLEFWTAAPVAGMLDRVRSAWPGWAVRWHGDRFESQVRRLRGVLHLPDPPSAEQLVRALVGHLGFDGDPEGLQKDCGPSRDEPGLEAAVRALRSLDGLPADIPWPIRRSILLGLSLSEG